MTTLEQDVHNLKTRLTRLETLVRHLAGDAYQEEAPASPPPLDQTHPLDWLKSQGLVRDPTPEEYRVAAAWDALSCEAQQAHIAEIQQLILDPPLSQILIEQRR